MPDSEPIAPAPEDAHARTIGRSWLIGAVVSALVHVAMLLLLMFGWVRDGDLTVTTRSDHGERAVSPVFVMQDVLQSGSIPSPVIHLSNEATSVKPANPTSDAGGVMAGAPSSSIGALAASLNPKPETSGAGVSASSPAVDMVAVGSDYRRRLLEHIAARRKIPPPGTAAGTVFVRFGVTLSGDVDVVSIAMSSSDPALDRIAIESIRGASPMPAIPAGLPDHVQVVLPIDFGAIDRAKVMTRP